MKLNSTVIVSIVALVLVVVVGLATYNVGYAAGNQAAQTTRAEFFANRAGGQGALGGQTGQNAQGQGNNQNGQNARGNFGRPVATGTVKSVQGNTLVVSEQNGNLVTVTIDPQTQIIKTVTGQSSDLQTGSRVLVTSDQTGSAVTARLITIQGQGAPQTP